MDAPLPVRVAEPELQIVVAELVIVSVGNGFTVTVTVLVFVHPRVFVPVTVYIVLMAGETTTLLPVNEPGFQVYVEAPLTLRVLDKPAQIVAAFAVAVKVGNELTFTLTVWVLTQNPLAPVML